MTTLSQTHKWYSKSLTGHIGSFIMRPYPSISFVHVCHLCPTEQLTVPGSIFVFIASFPEDFISACCPSSQSKDRILLLLKFIPHDTMTQLICPLNSYVFSYLFFCRHIFDFYFALHYFCLYLSILLALKLLKVPNCFNSCSCHLTQT